MSIFYLLAGLSSLGIVYILYYFTVYKGWDLDFADWLALISLGILSGALNIFCILHRKAKDPLGIRKK
ncbi:hypothetical protein BH10ACI1_BH10ACI1_02740 [soil metagenome]